MNFGMILFSILVSTTNLFIKEPVDGETYDGDWLAVRAIVENENELPDSVHYSLNGQPVILIPRLNTDWYTYMQNDLHHGYSESPAPTDNTVFWTAPITGTDHEFPTPVVVEGLVYYPQNENGDTLFALNATTGSVEWMFVGTGSTDDAVTVKDGRVYTASDSIWCLDALTGARIWSFGEANWVGGTPVVSDERVYCATCVSGDAKIFCIDALTGEGIWDTMVSGFTASCMTIWNGKLFVPTYSYSSIPPEFLLHALDANSGNIIWGNGDSFKGYWDSSPTVVDGNIYIGGTDGWLRAIDADSGNVIWKTYFVNDFITATPAYHSNTIYVGAQDPPFGSVECINGNFNWTVDLEIHGSPAVADGMVFFGEYSHNDSARVISLDCTSGDTVWTYMTTANRFQGSPSIADGILYIPAIDGNFYAFGTGLKYTYLDDLFAYIGTNELIVTSFDGGVAVAADTINFTITQTGITLEPSSRLALYASPNPFYSAASISFELSEPGWTSVTVYDLAGRTVSTLENSEITSGQHSYTWDGRRNNGDPVSAGLYLCRIQSGGISETTGLCLLR